MNRIVRSVSPESRRFASAAAFSDASNASDSKYGRARESAVPQAIEGQVRILELEQLRLTAYGHARRDFEKRPRVFPGEVRDGSN